MVDNAVLITRLTRVLAAEWDTVNLGVFKGALLHPPTIIIKDLSSRLGEWNPTLRQIMISEKCATTRPWDMVVEVLKHEMAHQYVTDVLDIGAEESAHGPAFKRTCLQYGIDGRAADKPNEEQLKVLEKIAKCLELSKSPNPNEAQAALTAAHALLKRNGLTEKDLQPREDDEIGVMGLGPIVGRCEKHHATVGAILSRFFHVKCIWIRVRDPRNFRERGFRLEISGRSSDLAYAEHVFKFLHDTAERLCPPHLKWHAKLSWKGSFMGGFFASLKNEEEAAKEALEALAEEQYIEGTDDEDTDEDAPSKELVAISNEVDTDVNAFFRRRYPHIVTRGGGGGRRHSSDGYNAGKNTKLNRPLENRGPKLLTSGS